MRSLLLFCLLAIKLTVFSATYTTTVTPGTWDIGGAPTGSDDVVVSHDWSSYNFNFLELQNAGSIVVNSSGYIKINGSIVVRGNSDITVNTGGTLEVTGSLDINGGGTGNFLFNGGIKTAGAVINGATITGSGTWEYSATFTNNGNINGFTSNPTFSPFSISDPSTPLPVVLVSFEVVEKDMNWAELQWTTASEINNDYFIVEKSIEGLNFEAIGKVSGNGNSVNLINYKFLDQNTESQVVYYRLKQVDFNGEFEYSPIITFSNKQNLKVIQCYPNPVKDYFFVESKEHENLILKIYNGTGDLVKKDETVGQNRYYVGDLSKGIYLITISNNQEILFSEKLIIH